MNNIPKMLSELLFVYVMVCLWEVLLLIFCLFMLWFVCGRYCCCWTFVCLCYCLSVGGTVVVDLLFVYVMVCLWEVLLLLLNVCLFMLWFVCGRYCCCRLGFTMLWQK